jgi:hypothetical protein
MEGLGWVTESSDRLFFRLELRPILAEIDSTQNGSRIALRERRPLLEYLLPPIFYRIPRAPVRRITGCARR